MIKKPKIIVISGPSGSGKNTIIGKLIEKRSDLEHCISTTTRNPRGGEIDGEHYYFVNHDEFQRMIAAGGFLEYAPVLKNFYGTSHAEIQRIKQSGKGAILDIDVQGALQLLERRTPPPKNPGNHEDNGLDFLFLFIEPPSLDTLKERLLLRGTETAEQIEERIELAQKEILEKTKYDHVILNDSLEKAIAETETLVQEFMSN